MFVKRKTVEKGSVSYVNCWQDVLCGSVMEFWLKITLLRIKPSLFVQLPWMLHTLSHILCVLLRSSARECPKEFSSKFEMNLTRVTEPTEPIRAVLVSLTVNQLPKKFLPILCKLKFLFLEQKREPLVLVQRQINPFLTLRPYFFCFWKSALILTYLLCLFRQTRILSIF